MASIDFCQLVQFSSGVEVLNCTPHVIVFLDGDVEVTVPPCGATLLAKAVESEVGQRGAVRLVTTVFVTSPQGEEELAEIAVSAPEALVVGSIISAQAYPGRVVAMTPAPGFERVPPAEKRMNASKFTVFS